MDRKRVQFKPTGNAGRPVVMLIDGVGHPPGAIGLSTMAAGMTEASFRSAAVPFLKELNSEHGIVDGPDGPIPFCEQPASWARVSHDRWLADQGCSTKPIAGRGGCTVSSGTDATTAARATAGGRRYVESLRLNGIFSGQNCFDINGLHLLSDAEKVVAFGRAPGADGRGDAQRYDNGAYWRFGRREHNLQTDAIFCGDAIMAALAGAPPAVIGCMTHIRTHALRAGIGGCGFDMFGIHKARGFERPQACYFNKGDRFVPTLRKALDEPLWHALRDHVDGDRRAFDREGRGWSDFAELSRLARRGDQDAELVLRGQKVWLIGFDRPLTYHNLVKTYVRPRLLEAGIEQTLHKLRHEHVYFRLREIEAMDVPAREKRTLRDRLAKDMGWTTQAMFKVYDAYEQERLRLEDQVAYQQRRELGAETAMHRGLLGCGERPQALPLVQKESVGRGFFFSLGRAA